MNRLNQLSILGFSSSNKREFSKPFSSTEFIQMCFKKVRETIVSVVLVRVKKLSNRNTKAKSNKRSKRCESQRARS